MRIAIFDVDGTLLDLPVDIEAARGEIAGFFAARGFAEPLRPILSQIQRGAAAIAADEAERMALVRTAYDLLDRHELKGAVRAVGKSGASLVAAHAAAGHPVALVTDNGKKPVTAALAAAGLGVLSERAMLVTRDDIAAGKPAPDGLLLAISRIGHSERDVVYVGDSDRDMEAAVRAERELAPRRIVRVGVAGESARAKTLTAAGAQHLVGSAADALGFL